MRKQIAQLDACCTPLGPAPLSTDEAGRMAEALGVLADAGLVDREQRGRWAFYRLRPEPLRLVADALVPRARSTAA